MGIPQWSPLSPILYVFDNANLVQGRISKSEVSISFVDDYNAWVTGPSEAKNTSKLQTQLLPRAEKTGKWRGVRGREDSLHSRRSCFMCRSSEMVA